MDSSLQGKQRGYSLCWPYLVEFIKIVLWLSEWKKDEDGLSWLIELTCILLLNCIIRLNSSPQITNIYAVAQNRMGKAITIYETPKWVAFSPQIYIFIVILSIIGLMGLILLRNNEYIEIEIKLNHSIQKQSTQIIQSQLLTNIIYIFVPPLRLVLPSHRHISSSTQSPPIFTLKQMIAFFLKVFSIFLFSNLLPRPSFGYWCRNKGKHSALIGNMSRLTSCASFTWSQEKSHGMQKSIDVVSYGQQEGLWVRPQGTLKSLSHLITDLGFVIIKQSYQQVNRGGRVMTKKQDIGKRAKKGKRNLQAIASMKKHRQDHYNDPSNLHSTSSYQNPIVNPTSSIQSNESPGALQNYFKIKSMDKTEDTLRWIRAKRQAFICYVDQLNHQQQQPNSQLPQNYTQLTAQINQQFSEFTFYKNCKTNTQLFARITCSHAKKCNISITNLQGEILKYYWNVALSRKEGTIKRFIAKNLDVFLFVFDYTQAKETLKKLPSILRDSHLLYYRLININDGRNMDFHQNMKMITQGFFRQQNCDIVIVSKNVFEENRFQDIHKICNKIDKIVIQQDSFLRNVRGCKRYINFSIDSMLIAVGRQFKLTGVQLINKIKTLFVLKEMELESMMIQSPKTLHVTKEMPRAQNCCSCMSLNIQLKRPKRTHTICQRCTAQERKPIYLCRDCFTEYHTSKNLYIFKKNEKRNKIKRKIFARKIGRRIVHRNIPNEVDNNEIQEKPTENEMILLKLDKQCDQFFEKIDELIEERSISSAQYYLTMLMNLTILKTHQYQTSISTKLQDGMKVEA